LQRGDAEEEFEMSCGCPRSLLKILSLCSLLIIAALAPARADGERRFAPKATTPEELGRSYLTFILIPAMREALAKLPETQRPDVEGKLTLWSIQVYDAILDFESNSAVTSEQAVGYLKSNNASDAAISAFKSGMANANPENKDAYQQDIGEAVLDAVHVGDIERNGGRSVPRTGTPAVALASIRNWVGKNGGRAGSARVWELLGRQPIPFHREPYDSAREFLERGDFPFITSPYTAEAEKLGTLVPADEISPPDFPLESYSDRRLMKQIYEHDFNAHSGAIDPAYLQEFLLQLGRQDGGCPDLAIDDPVVWMKVQGLSLLHGSKTFMGIYRADLMEASQSRQEMNALGKSLGTALNNEILMVSRVYRGRDDANAMIMRYGCKSPEVSRFLKNLTDYIRMN
jgi:hypothetical protein